MKHKKAKLILATFFYSLMAQGQGAPASGANWDSDPLDVLEAKKQKEAATPALPEFEEVPAATAVESPKKEVAKKTGTSKKSGKHKKSKIAAEFSAGGSADPDFQKEARFNSVYRSYNQQPTPVEAWEKVSTQRKSENYQVQKGDTLSDISTTLFGDPNFWPKIWSFNSGTIENPHEIVPAMPIRFFAGSMENTPTVELGAKSPEAKPAAPTETEPQGTMSGAESSEVIAATKLPLPPPAKKYPPLLMDIPQSLPDKKIMVSPADVSKVELQLRASAPLKTTAYLEYYVSEAPVEGVGTVVGAELDLKAVGEHTFVYVHLETGAQRKLTVVKNLEPLKNLNAEEGSPVAHLVEVQGQIEVLEPVNIKKNIYRAMVKKSINLVEVGSVLIAGDMPTMDTAATSIVSANSAQIIGGDYSSKRNLFGPQSLVFLNAGSKKGFKVGSSYTIFADETLRNPATDIIASDRQVGVVKILRTTDNFSTGYVTQSKNDIIPGDYVGSVFKGSNNVGIDDSSTPSNDSPASGSGSKPDDLEL